MGDRTFVVIFFFWAALTIITPMLILLSESSKPITLDSQDVIQSTEAVTPRKMMGEYAEKKWNMSTTAAARNVSAGPTEAPQPSPEPDDDHDPKAADTVVDVWGRLADDQ
ncbi:hypothetical protein LINGRAHAP2_LOCUS23913 [Linum grandiflorum]